MPARREIVWIHDITGAQVDATAHGFLELYTDERLDQSEQLHLTIASDHPKANRFAPDIELIHRGRRYFVTEIEQRRQDTRTTIAVEADALWYRLGDLSYAGSFLLDDVTPAEGLALILADTVWNVDTNTTLTGDTFSMEQQDKSRLELLRTWSKITGRPITFNTGERTVGLPDTRGTDLGLSFRYGRNLTGIRRRLRPPEVTRLLAYGADGLTISGINGGSPYVEDLSYYTAQGLTTEQARAMYTRSLVWSDSSFVKEADLLAAAETKLAAEAGEIITYELNVVDLSELTAVAEEARPGDTVRVYDPDFGEDVRPVVTRFRRHWLEPWRNQIELSTLLDPVSDGSSQGRGARSAEWIQFVGPVGADYQIRNDGDYIVARIPLRFREGGRANYHLDLWAVGVDAGVLVVRVEDAANGNALQFKEVRVPYTDAETVRAVISWATEEIIAQHDYRVVVTTEASGGADPTKGVDIAIDQTDPVEASWWILAQGAVQESPTSPNSQTFNYTGSIQTFTVPDNVTEITIQTTGAGQGAAGGCRATATFPAVPGEILDVYVGGQGGTAGGWPDGGKGGYGSSSNRGKGGSGSSQVRPSGGSISTALLIAPGSGGADESQTYAGGIGGFFQGGNGVQVSGSCLGGTGATQYVPGIGSTGPTDTGEDGDVDGEGQGGDAPDIANSFVFPPGGGGGGRHGGGAGAGYVNTGGGNYGSGGGGGSGWIAATGYDLEIVDGANTSAGQVVISWSDPL